MHAILKDWKGIKRIVPCGTGEESAVFVQPPVKSGFSSLVVEYTESYDDGFGIIDSPAVKVYGDHDWWPVDLVTTNNTGLPVAD